MNCETTAREYIHVIYPEGKVYNPKLRCIGKGMERALQYQKNHRLQIYVHCGMDRVVDFIRPSLKVLKTKNKENLK